MKLKDPCGEFGLESEGRCGAPRPGRYGGVSDLMSDVLAHAVDGNVWVTLHIHQNIVAVAAHKGLAGIILVQGRQPEKDTVAKAAEEGIPVMVSAFPAFELVGRLYKAGIRGA